VTTIVLQGGKELAAALRNASKDMQAAVADAVTATGLELRGDVVKRIQRGPATGRTYQRRGVTHTASAPGQAPATDTGRLANSVTFEQAGPVSVTVGSALIYAAYLEYGTTRMAPRPVWRPAVEDMAPKFRNRLLRALGMALD
jgi:HK97 gp10 family phage protein